MKIVHTLSALAICFSPLSALAETQPLTTAVLDFEVGDKALEAKGRDAAILLNATLSSAPELILVERQEVEKLLSEQELGLSGMVDSSTAAKVGKLLGAKILVTGRVFQSGKEYLLVAKVIGTETGRVYGETEQFSDLNQLSAAIKSLSGKVQEVVAKKGETLVAKVETPAEREEPWRKLVAGKKLRSISVNVKEQHISHAIPDPAVQTEFELILGQLGFKVIDSKESKETPDIEITGEAFSELGGRKANLVSCRARTEVRVVNRLDGKLLLSDRQVEPGVDLAENIAAKTALQNTAIKLLDRIIPVLTE